MGRLATLLLAVFSFACASSPAPVAPAPVASAPAPKPAATTTPARTDAGSTHETATQSSPHASEPADAAKGEVLLTTYFEALRADGTRRAFVSGESLRSGDRFSLVIGLSEPLYLYVLYAGSDGVASVLYPAQGDVLVAAGPARRFPEGQEFELDDVPGWEHILIVATREPLSKTEQALGALVERVRTTHEWPESPAEAASVKASPPAPKRVAPTKRSVDGPRAEAKTVSPAASAEPILEARLAGADVRGVTRGVQLRPAGSPRIEAIPDAAGVIAIPLRIRHLP